MIQPLITLLLLGILLFTLTQSHTGRFLHAYLKA